MNTFEYKDQESSFLEEKNAPKLLSKVILPPPLDIIQVPLEDDRQIPGEIILDKQGKLLRQYIEYRGVTQSIIDLYNDWIRNRLHLQVNAPQITFKNGTFVKFTLEPVIAPRYSHNGQMLHLLPQKARESGLTYGIDLYVKAIHYQPGINGNPPTEITTRLPETQTKEHAGKGFIGLLPVMVGTEFDNLHGILKKDYPKYGEDPTDPMGYFIIKGTERIIQLQEMLRVNKLILVRLKGILTARMTLRTTRGTSIIEMVQGDEGTLEVRLSSFTKSEKSVYESIGIFQLFSLLNIGTDDAVAVITKFLTPENRSRCLAYLIPSLSIAHLYSDRIKNVAFMASKMNIPDSTPASEIEKLVSKALDNDLFLNITEVNPVNSMDPNNDIQRAKTIRGKAYMLAYMTANMLEYLAGFRKLDDRDSWSNKRLVSSGMMEQLFSVLWKKVVKYIQVQVSNGSVHDLNGVMGNIRSTIITDEFCSSFVSSWGAKRSVQVDNITQILERKNKIATLHHLTRINVNANPNDKQASMRMVQQTQWGYICIVSTPEGAVVGLVKNLAVTANISLELPDSTVLPYLVNDISDLSRDTRNTPIFINGKIYGWCNGPELLIKARGLRRSGAFPRDTSVLMDSHKRLHIHVDGGRLTRPLLIVGENGRLEIDNKNMWGRPFPDLLNNGIVEYLDPEEQESKGIRIAINADFFKDSTERNIRKNIKQLELDLQMVLDGEEIMIRRPGGFDEMDVIPLDKSTAEQNLLEAREYLDEFLGKGKFTHCELDPQAILGVAASIIPMISHNQAPRNVYQVAMGKQAMGVIHSNAKHRFDSNIKSLAFPSRPLIETQLAETLGINKAPQGKQLITCFLALPYNQEDAFHVNKTSIDLGRLKFQKDLEYKTTLKSKNKEGVVEKLGRPEVLKEGEEYIYRHINKNGLPSKKAYLKDGDVVISKIVTHPDGTVRYESEKMGVGDEGQVSKIVVTSDHHNTLVRIKLTMFKNLQVGDKLSSRYAQKGTIGVVVSEENMPYDPVTGMIADIFINTHALPSRMTMGLPGEMIAGRYALMTGTRINASAFRFIDLDSFYRYFQSIGQNPLGYVKMRLGVVPRDIDCLVFSGPVYWQLLSHHVEDKKQARGTGAVKAATRQPVKGRKDKGGIRVGEMERDALLSHGAAYVTQEKLMYVSDAWTTVYCKTCGIFALPEAGGTTHTCRLCGSKGIQGNFGKCTIPYSCKVLQQFLAGAGIYLRFSMVTEEEHVSKISSSVKNRIRTVALPSDQKQGSPQDTKDSHYEDEDNEEENEEEDAKVSEEERKAKAKEFESVKAFDSFEDPDAAEAEAANDADDSFFHTENEYIDESAGEGYN